MSFTVKVTFGGLGLALVYGKQEDPEAVTGVDMLLVDTSQVHPHRPLLTIKLEDVAKTEESDFPGAHVSALGSPLVELDLTNKDLQVVVTGNPGRCGLKRPFRSSATHPGFLASKEAINWIPDATQNMGIPLSDIVLPGDNLDGSPYISRLRLPAGNLLSADLLLKSDGTLSEATFGSDPTRRALSERIVWMRNDVDSFELKFGKGISLDALVRDMQDEPEVVEISITNLPIRFLPGRFPFPDHFPMYRLIRKSGEPPNLVRPAEPADVTRGGSCPPLVAEVLS